MATPKRYEILSPVSVHPGRVEPIGDFLSAPNDLTELEAQRLVKIGVLRPKVAIRRKATE